MWLHKHTSGSREAKVLIQCVELVPRGSGTFVPQPLLLLAIPAEAVLIHILCFPLRPHHLSCAPTVELCD